MPWDETFESVADLLPEASVPLASLRILSYLNAEGKQFYAIACGGDLPKAAFVGFIEVAKHDFLQRADVVED